MGRELEQLPLSSADIKNKWSYTSALSICLLGVNRNNFSFMYRVFLKYAVNRIRSLIPKGWRHVPILTWVPKCFLAELFRNILQIHRKYKIQIERWFIYRRYVFSTEHLLQVRSKKHCHRTDSLLSPKFVGLLRNVSQITATQSMKLSIIKSEVGYIRDIKWLHQ